MAQGCANNKTTQMTDLLFAPKMYWACLAWKEKKWHTIKMPNKAKRNKNTIKWNWNKSNEIATCVSEPNFLMESKLSAP